MSVLYDGLDTPGILIDVEQEISQDYDPSNFGNTDSVVIIGTAFSGPTGVPVELYNSDMAAYYFGGSYDAKTHRTASLLPGVIAAEAAGCQTIYGMRIGGKDTYKDFKLCEDTDKYRLRIASVYPTNRVKESFIRINVTAGEESITLYKPMDRATIAEKKTGIVDSSDELLLYTLYLNAGQGLTKNDRLSAMVEAFNSNVHNNIFIMSIVDKNGDDVTLLPEAQDLRIGSLFSGIYFVGRDHNAEGFNAYTSLGVKAILSDSDPKPYSAYKGKFYRTIIFNSDVASDYPITAESYSEMRNALKDVSVMAGNDYDFLEIAGVADRVWIPDEIDYEEADLSGFELYKRLGDGYAITAKAIARVGTDAKGRVRKPRIVESASDDENHIVAITNGTYSILKNAEIDYRVLVAGNADDKLVNKLPKASEFKVANANEVKLLGLSSSEALIEAVPIIDKTDLSLPKSYSFEFYKIDEENTTLTDVSKIYLNKTATVVSELIGDTPEDAIKELIDNSECTIKNGTIFLFKTSEDSAYTLIRMESGNPHKLTMSGLAGELFDLNDKLYIGKADDNGLVTFDLAKMEDLENATENTEYILVDSGNSVYVSKIDTNTSTTTTTTTDPEDPEATPIETTITTTSIDIDPIGTLNALMSDNEAKTLIYAEDCYNKTNRIIVRTAAADYIPLEEFVEILQEDDTIGKMFTFKLTEYAADIKNEYPEDIENNYSETHDGRRYFGQTLADGTVVPPQVYTLTANKIIDYDYTKYVPYRTTDTFERQLAQHCAEASLRNRMTHGVIGMTPIRNTSLSSVDNRVEELLELSKNSILYAKKGNGRSLLNPDGSAYEIGDRISTTVFQTPVTDSKSSYTTLTNGAAAYAGMISALAPDGSTTLQPIVLQGGAGYTLSETQANQLSQAGYVVTKENPRMGTVIVDGVTRGNPSYLTSRLSIIRTINILGESMRAAAEPFISKKNSMHNRSSLRTAIESAIDVWKDVIIEDCTFVIRNEATYTADARIDIYYELQPLNEIRSVYNNITVRRRATT